MLTMGRQENDPNYDDNAQKSLFANQLFVPYMPRMVRIVYMIV